MEQWEIDKRAKLEKELPEGLYQIGGGYQGALMYHTGKEGKINFEIALEKRIREIEGNPDKFQKLIKSIIDTIKKDDRNR